MGESAWGHATVTVAQGNETDGKGFNPPSLLGTMLGGPYFHAGQARTLEAALSDTFGAHLRALNASFLPSSDPAYATNMSALIQFLLSIDDDAATIATPALGPTGGSLCTYP